MLWEGCLVRIDGNVIEESKTRDMPFFTTEEGQTIISASGVLLQNGIVLVSGNTLSPFLTTRTPRLAALVKGAKVFVCKEVSDDKKYDSKGQWLGTTFLGVVSLDNDTIRAAQRLVNSTDVRKIEETGFATVGVLRIRSLETINRSTGVDSHVNLNPSNSSTICKNTTHLHRGDPLTVISSPFGLVSPKIFRNSFTSGTLSNLIYERGNENPSLLLTDAVTHPGGEGGGVADIHGHLIGLVAPTLHWGTKSCFEFTCILPINLCWLSLSRRGWVPSQLPVFSYGFSKNALSQHCVSSLTNLADSQAGNCFYNRNLADFSMNKQSLLLHTRDAITTAEKSLVCLRIRKSWASGILLNGDGYILTCAHLLKPFMKSNTPNKLKNGMKLMIRCDGCFIEQWQPADVIYVSKGAIDFAVVKIAIVPRGAKAIQFARNGILRGQKATVFGHALFDPSNKIEASVCKGVVSNVTMHKGKPAIVQSSACVFRGDSGGMLLDQHGRLLGMITSNAKQADGNIIPRINFSVPKSLLEPMSRVDGLMEYMKSLDTVDQELQSLWNLEDVEDEPDVGQEDHVQASKL